MREDETLTSKILEQKLFELMLAIDVLSVKKDYAGLRNKHFEDMNWINEHGMDEDYYNYLFTHYIKPGKLIQAENLIMGQMH